MQHVSLKNLSKSVVLIIGVWGLKASSKLCNEFLSIEGLNDFYRFNRCLTFILDEGRAKTVLQAFSDGRWRAVICFIKYLT